MNSGIIALVALSWIFGIAAILLAFRQQRLKKQLQSEDEKNKHRLYEIAVLKEIQDRIGYSLDIEKVTDVITGSLKHLFPYSTASSLVIAQNRLVFKVTAEESVNHVFIEKVKSNMHQALQGLVVGTLPAQIDESVAGSVSDDTNDSTPASFFNVPLIVNEKVGGVINVASTKPNIYKEEDKTILYQIISQASTALARLEAVLVTEKGKLMAMIGSLADGVFMVDTMSKLTVINEAAKEFLHIAKEEPNIVEVLTAFPNDVDLGGKITIVIQQNQTIEIKEVALGDKIVQIFITPVLDENITDRKVVLGASVLLHDITLEKTIGKMKEDFTNMMVHELRAPLTSVKVSAELLAKSEATLQPEQKQQLLHLIDTQSKSLLEEVSAILDAAKLEAGRLEINKQPTDLMQVIQEKTSLFAPQAQAKHVHLTLAIPEALPEIAVDKQYIGRVIQNLISNSMKFTPEGGSVSVIARRKDQDIEIMVSDTGPGIPKDKQANLFNRFSQVGTSTMNHQGTGLGLYISKGIIEAHGGTISLTSEEGHGTTISFTLPIVTMAAPTQDAQPRPMPQVATTPMPQAQNKIPN
jgi:NtrC-family two-component system sensor histidine kinase KinB